MFRRFFTAAAATTLLAVATPAQAATQCVGCLGYVGDSLTYQGSSGAARSSLLSAGWLDANMKVDGLTGRGLPLAGVVHPNYGEVIDSWRTAGFEPYRVVIALGSNNLGSTDTQWRTWIMQDLDKLTSGNTNTYEVFWVGLALRPDVSNVVPLRFQAVLNTIVHDRIVWHPLDWNSYIHNGRDETGLWQTSDSTGRHMTSFGYAIRNSFITAAVGAP